MRRALFLLFLFLCAFADVQGWERSDAPGLGTSSGGAGDLPGRPGSGVPASGNPLKGNKDREVGAPDGLEEKGKGFLVDGKPYKYDCTDAKKGQGSCKEESPMAPKGDFAKDMGDTTYDGVSHGNMKLAYGKHVAYGALAGGNYDGGPNYVPTTGRGQQAKSIVSPTAQLRGSPPSPYHEHQIIGAEYPPAIPPQHKVGNGVPLNAKTQQVPLDEKGNKYGVSPQLDSSGQDWKKAQFGMPVPPSFGDGTVGLATVGRGPGQQWAPSTVGAAIPFVGGGAASGRMGLMMLLEKTARRGGAKSRRNAPAGQMANFHVDPTVQQQQQQQQPTEQQQHWAKPWSKPWDWHTSTWPNYFPYNYHPHQKNHPSPYKPEPAGNSNPAMHAGTLNPHSGGLPPIQQGGPPPQSWGLTTEQPPAQQGQQRQHSLLEEADAKKDVQKKGAWAMLPDPVTAQGPGWYINQPNPSLPNQGTQRRRR
eukprot:g1388.t1